MRRKWSQQVIKYSSCLTNTHILTSSNYVSFTCRILCSLALKPRDRFFLSRWWLSNPQDCFLSQDSRLFKDSGNCYHLKAETVFLSSLKKIRQPHVLVFTCQCQSSYQICIYLHVCCSVLAWHVGFWERCSSKERHQTRASSRWAKTRLRSEERVCLFFVIMNMFSFQRQRIRVWWFLAGIFSRCHESPVACLVGDFFGSCIFARLTNIASFFLPLHKCSRATQECGTDCPFPGYSLVRMRDALSYQSFSFNK